MNSHSARINRLVKQRAFLHAESKAGFASALSEPARFRECCTSNMDAYLTGVICVKTPPGRFSESSFSVEKIERESFLTLLRVPYLAIRDQRASHASPAFSSPKRNVPTSQRRRRARPGRAVVQFPITTVRAPCRDGIDRLVYHFSDSVVFPLCALGIGPGGRFSFRYRVINSRRWSVVFCPSLMAWDRLG